MQQIDNWRKQFAELSAKAGDTGGFLTKKQLLIDTNAANVKQGMPKLTERELDAFLAQVDAEGRLEGDYVKVRGMAGKITVAWAYRLKEPSKSPKK